MDTKHSFVLVKKRELIALVVLGIIALAALALSQSRSAFISPEVKFTDASKSGLAIVPASCPSNPHFAGDCTTNPAPPAPGGCSITATDDGIAPGGQTTLSWATANDAFSLGSLPPTGGTIAPGLGAVNATQGSQVVEPSQTTTYTLSGTYQWAGVSVGSFVCSHTIYVTPCPTGYTPENGSCVFTTCPAGHVLSGNTCLYQAGSACTAGYICEGNYSVYQDATCALSQYSACPYGCAGGACYIPVPSIVTWSVLPLLVRSGSTAHITWAADNVASCTVTGSNGDGTSGGATGAWTGNEGDQNSSPITGQTIYTITCQGFPGATPASVTESTTVNIVPLFQEQ
jgi:hypothetical protein